MAYLEIHISSFRCVRPCGLKSYFTKDMAFRPLTLFDVRYHRLYRIPKLW